MGDIFLDVAELFYSIQGESTRAGLPCLFVRLAGCNLRCAYCDSKYTWEEQGTETSVSDILAWVEKYPEAIVEITGGEPLLQEGTYILMEELLLRDRTVLLETNGSLSIEKVPEKVVVILDIKCPDSSMDSSFYWKNIEILLQRTGRGSGDEIKFVITSEQDFYWAKEIVRKYGLDRIAPVLFSPVMVSISPTELAERILRHRLPVRLQLQLHKILWPEHERGV